MDHNSEFVPSTGHRIWRVVKEAVIVLVGALVVSAILQHFVGQMFIIPSGSMENTLKVSDRVIAEKITEVERGDIAVFRDSSGWLGPHPMVERTGVGQVLEFVGLLPDTSHNYLIKRVIGMPGDVVECCDAEGRMTVNGFPLEEDAYLYRSEEGEAVAPSDVQFRVVVPEGRMFVMGDHRNASADSRCHLADSIPGQPQGAAAFVPLQDVAGTGWAIFAPFNRTRLLPAQDAFVGVPDPVAPAPQQAVIEPAGVTC